jgi:XapX domain-containing protein
MFKIIIGFLIAFLIGAACRYFELPVPAPPALLGVALIFAISLGFIVTDNFLAKQNAALATQSEVKNENR